MGDMSEFVAQHRGQLRFIIDACQQARVDHDEPVGHRGGVEPRVLAHNDADRWAAGTLVFR
jgi:hypothetical protein